jgi:hypothetical protein
MNKKRSVDLTHENNSDPIIININCERKLRERKTKINYHYFNINNNDNNNDNNDDDDKKNNDKKLVISDDEKDFIDDFSQCFVKISDKIISLESVLDNFEKTFNEQKNDRDKIFIIRFLKDFKSSKMEYNSDLKLSNLYDLLKQKDEKNKLKKEISLLILQLNRIVSLNIKSTFMKKIYDRIQNSIINMENEILTSSFLHEDDNIEKMILKYI